MLKLNTCSSSLGCLNGNLLIAMEAVNRELETHFEHLCDPHFLGNTREHISRYAAAGVARGFFAIALHQQFLGWQLDNLAVAQSLAD